MTPIQKLREIQNDEVSNGFKNGQLWNDIEDMIWKLENPHLLMETENVGDYKEASWHY